MDNLDQSSFTAARGCTEGQFHSTSWLFEEHAVTYTYRSGHDDVDSLTLKEADVILQEAVDFREVTLKVVRQSLAKL